MTMLEIVLQRPLAFDLCDRPPITTSGPYSVRRSCLLRFWRHIEMIRDVRLMDETPSGVIRANHIDMPLQPTGMERHTVQ